MTRHTQLDGLVSRYGVVRRLTGGAGHRGLGELWEYQADLGSGYPGTGTSPQVEVVTGGRTIGDPELARLLAIAEGAERYAAGQFSDDGVVLSTVRELPGRVLDPERYPRCSPAEYADPLCRLRPFDPEVPIRWLQGVDLRDGVPTWVPLPMAAYRTAHLLPSERFWSGISTGYAVHTDPAAALFGGISEVVERDMVSLIWLQQLRLPRVPESALPAEVGRILDWCGRRFIETTLLDATSDIGIPTVYVVHRAPHDDRAYTVVGCATGLTLGAAARKALLEVVGVRQAVRAEEEDSERLDELTLGARLMGTPERAAAFDFLFDPAPPRAEPPPYAADAWAGVLRAVARFAELDMPVVALDRTTTELASVGLAAVNVVVPDLQPMTLDQKVQYRGHRRLYEAPARMGHRALPEEELNPWPQPFA